MSLLTVNEKRILVIANASNEQFKGEDNWHRELDQKMTQQIEQASPDKKLSVIVEWIKMAEHVGAVAVKNHILKKYNSNEGTDSKSSDQKEVRDDDEVREAE